MAEGLNTYQLAGLVGTGLSQIASAGSMYAQGGMQAAQANIQAGAMDSTGILSSAQTMIESDLQTILREQEQADLAYQASVTDIDISALQAQSELIKAEAKHKEGDRIKALNAELADVVMKGVAQNRAGGTINNILRQNAYQAEKDADLIKSQERMLQSNIQSQIAKKQLAGETAKLSIGMSEAMSTYEQKVAKSQSKYQKVSGAIQAQAARDQAKYSSRMATAGAIGSIGGAAMSLGMAYGGMGGAKKATPTTKVK